MIRFAATATPEHVSAHSRAVVERILLASGNEACTVTSTVRTPEAQVRAMHANILAHGVGTQRRLYKAAGNAVIDAYEANAARTKREQLDAMLAALIRVGPENVSRHCADPSLLNVLDIAPSSLARPAEFRTAAERDPDVSKVLGPPTDPAFHLEIPQPKAAA